MVERRFGFATAILVLGGGAILAALAFQHLGGYVPCALCLQQRWPYYVGLPIAAAAAFMARRGVATWPIALAFLAVAAVFAYGAGLGVYHAGVEWRWWPGPNDCAAGAARMPEGAGDLLATLRTVRVTPCDEAAWRFLGISFAGYNALISALLAVLGLAGAVAHRQGSSSLSQ